ncbi:MAG: phosphotransferase [Chthonomonadaceae bacterium]|nr:phosphotransferase [Chthonomonadaceae bacterium]
MHGLDDAFVGRIEATFGAEGRQWLETFPSLLERVCAHWGLVRIRAFPNLSYNYVAGAERGGEPVVVKLGVPCRELRTEVGALRVYGGHGAVRLLDADEGLGALLLERLVPGASLTTLDDAEATVAAAQVMRDLHRAPPLGGAFPTIEDWFGGFDRLRRRFEGGTGPFPTALVEAAETMGRELLAEQAPARLLHGDLHHENVLSAGRAPWLAIDPKGVEGEPAYEPGAWLRNPPGFAQQPGAKERTRRRIAQFAEILDLDPVRIALWAACQAVLSVWWSFEDGDREWRSGLGTAELLCSIP